MLPKFHALAKTDIEARRAIQRLEQFAELNPNDEFVKNNTVSGIIKHLKGVRDHIPAEFRDTDLVK